MSIWIWSLIVGTEITVFYVCGHDHFIKCGLESGFSKPRQGVVCIPRSGNPVVPSNASTLVYGCSEVIYHFIL